MNRIIGILSIMFLALASATSCLFENDMAYPRVPADIVKFSVKGAVSTDIDATKKHVSIVLGETEDISKVTIEEFEISPTAELVGAMPETLDLTDTVELTLKAWYDYKWTISATQPIDRHIHVENQVGEAQFDLNRRYAEVYVTENQSLENIVFTDVKLEPEGSVIGSTSGYIVVDGEEKVVTQECNFPMTLPCVNRRFFMVNYKGEWLVWSVKVFQKKIDLQVKSANPWCHHAEIIGHFDGTGTPSIEYKKKADADWTAFNEIAIDGLDISANLTGLTEDTEYQVRIKNGEKTSSVVDFKTETPEQLENMSFDQWYQAAPNNCWYPCPRVEAGKIWDTANKGMNMFNEQNPSRPISDFVAVPGEGKQAVQLKSMDFMGMFAAGNVLTGNFIKAVVMPSVGAELTWGTPFKGRPRALKGYYAYSPLPIDKCSAKHKDKLGQMDQCQILVMLTDWEKPFLVKTATETFVDQVNDPHIIAHGTIESDENTNGEYREFRCELKYRDTMRKPTHVVVIACSSLYGDYFTGGIGSTMWVDEFEFEYD